MKRKNVQRKDIEYGEKNKTRNVAQKRRYMERTWCLIRSFKRSGVRLEERGNQKDLQHVYLMG